jgi:hypothetical protein
MTTNHRTDDELDRVARDIKSAVHKCRVALSDLLPDQKASALEQLHLWLELEIASADPRNALDKRARGMKQV